MGVCRCVCVGLGMVVVVWRVFGYVCNGVCVCFGIGVVVWWCGGGVWDVQMGVVVCVVVWVCGEYACSACVHAYVQYM